MGQTASKATATLPIERGERSRKMVEIMAMRAGRWFTSRLWRNITDLFGNMLRNGPGDSLITFRNCQRRRLSHIRTNIRCTLLDCQHNDTANHWNLYATQHPQRHSSDQWITIREVFLKGIDG